MTAPFQFSLAAYSDPYRAMQETQAAIDAGGGGPSTDAPLDGYWYGRQNAVWVQVVPVSPPTGNVNIGLANAGNPGVVTGTHNISIGTYAGQALTTGGANVSIGENAGKNMTTPSNN